MEDQAIINLYLNRTESAISETNVKYGRLCNKIAANITGSLSDAQECVNDTYLKAWNTIPPTIPKSLSAYIARITRNISISRYRKNTSMKRGSGEVDLVISELEECLPGNSTVESEYESTVLTNTIAEYLKSVSSEKQQIFIHRYWYNDSIEEIADKFGMNKNNVKSILFRMRSSLKEYLEGEGITI